MRANVFLAELGPKSSRNTRIVHDFEGANILDILEKYTGRPKELKEISSDMYWLQKYILENDPNEGTSAIEWYDKGQDKKRANKIGMYLKRLQKSQNVTLGNLKVEDVASKNGDTQNLIRAQHQLKIDSARRHNYVSGPIIDFDPEKMHQTKLLKDIDRNRIAIAAASTNLGRDSVSYGVKGNAITSTESEQIKLASTTAASNEEIKTVGTVAAVQVNTNDAGDKVTADVAQNPKDTTAKAEAEAEAARKAEADTEARIRAEVEAEHKARAQANSKLEIQARAQEQDDAEEATAISRHEKIQKAEAARKAQAEAKKAELAGRREAMKQAWLHDDLSKITNADDLKKAQGMYSDRAGGFTSGGPPRIKGEEPNLLKYVQGQRINQDTGKWEQKKPVVSKWKDPSKDVEGGRD